jgi:oxygen-independent coproporphyrinogen-3 oxidase
MIVNSNHHAILAPESIPISLYIHLPWCIKKCPYCDFNSYDCLTVNKDVYLTKLAEQAKIFHPALQDRSLSSIFIGGGTPNLFTIKQLNQLLKNILSTYTLEKNAEITLEANPGINKNDFKWYTDIGVNRISLGVQSFQSTYLQSLGRLYDEHALFETVNAIQKSNIKNFNIDLMFGLPKQTLKDSLLDLRLAIDCHITHLSWYELTIAPHTHFANKQVNLPSDITIEAIQKKGSTFLKRKNWQQYEISAFSLPSYQCKHNLNYWQFGDYIGLGAGAHSKVTQFKKQKIIRFENHQHVPRYCQAFVSKEQILSKKEATIDFMINALRLYQPISLKHFVARTGNFLDAIKKFIKTAEEKNFIASDKNFITTTKKGKKFMNQLLLELVTFE